MKPFTCNLLPAAILLASVSASANDDLFGSSQDSDDLFGGGDSFISDTVDNSTNLADEMLTNEEGIVWSGSYEWTNAAQVIDHDMMPDDTELTTEFSGNLKLDARPDADYRALLNLDYSVGLDSADLTVREGFADFSAADNLFIRAGQQTLSWGVGYFFSPADNLSTDALDASDPDADRVGTMAVKAHVPVNTSNYYGYLLPDDARDDYTIAVKSEWLIGTNEVALGAIRHSDDEINIVSTASIPTELGDFFAEYVLTTNEQTPDISETMMFTDRSDELLHQFTLGVMASEDYDFASVRASAQYYYNGKGFDHAAWLDNPMGWNMTASTEPMPEHLGQHQVALMLSLSDVFDTSISASTIALGSLTDESYMVQPSLSWAPTDHIKTTASASFMQGQMGSEYATFGDLNQYKLTLSLGSQSF